MKKADFFFFISISSGCSAELLRTALLSHDSFPKQSGGQNENLRQRRILEALQCILSFEGSRVGQGWKWEDKLLLDCILTPQFWHLKNRSWKHVSHLIIFRIKRITQKVSAGPSHSFTHSPPINLRAPWGLRPGPACSLLCPSAWHRV